MRNSFVVLVLLLSLSSCINKDVPNQEMKKAENQSFTKIDLKYSKGFKVNYFEGGKHVQILHPKTGEVLQELVLIANENAVIPENLESVHQFKLPIHKFASQSTTHVSFLDKIDELEGLEAISFANFIKNLNTKKRIDSGEIKDLTQGNSLNVELLLDLNPELIFMYPFDQKSVETIKEHISPVLTTEYLELSPLAKAEWLKFFAIFFNQEEKATQIFAKIEQNYLKQKAKAAIAPSCFVNLPFQNKWNCPPGNSYTTALLEDSGFDYIYKNSIQDGNLVKGFEEILDECMELDYWVIFAQRAQQFQLENLIEENPVYKEFKAVRKKNVIMCNTSVSDYFGDALVEPDVLLSNLQEILSGESDSTQYFYRLR